MVHLRMDAAGDIYMGSQSAGHDISGILLHRIYKDSSSTNNINWCCWNIIIIIFFFTSLLLANTRSFTGSRRAHNDSGCDQSSGRTCCIRTSGCLIMHCLVCQSTGIFANSHSNQISGKHSTPIHVSVFGGVFLLERDGMSRVTRSQYHCSQYAWFVIWCCASVTQAKVSR